MSLAKPSLLREVSPDCTIEIAYIQRKRHFALFINGVPKLNHATYDVLEHYVEMEWPVLAVDDTPVA